MTKNSTTMGIKLKHKKYKTILNNEQQQHFMKKYLKIVIGVRVVVVGTTKAA